jgi:cell division transport system permease protein
MHAIRYAFDEALASLWRGRRSGILSMATIAVALFVLGGFLLATSNLERLGSEWSRAAEMSVYVDDGATAAEKTGIEGLLGPSTPGTSGTSGTLGTPGTSGTSGTPGSLGSIVGSYEFVSKPEALKRFKQTFADLAATVDSLGNNPLPASYEVRLRPSAQASDDVESLAERLRKAPGVTDVRYDRQWLDRLLSAVNVVRVVGLVLGVVLTVAAALTVANVVRLALYARQDEIEIMHLVGAPNVYVRGPCVMEGVLQGGLGALAALATLAVVFLAVRSRYLMPVASALNLSSVRFLPLELCVMLLVGGMLVGCLGGIVAASARVGDVT